MELSWTLEIQSFLLSLSHSIGFLKAMRRVSLESTIEA